MRCSLHSWLTVLPLNPAGGMVWLDGTSASYNPCADLCQPPLSSPPAVGGDNVDVSGTQLP
jgi:hypothetical protein